MPANSEPNVPAATRAPRASWLGFGSARLDEYFGVWAIDLARGEALAQRASRLNLRLHVEQQEQAADETLDAANPQPASRFGDGYGETLLEDGTGIIRVEGTLVKFASSMSRGTGTVQLRRMVRGARNDASVLRVMVVIDSAGGTVAGTQALAQDLAELAAAKPVHVFVEDLMASAALWIGVQGTTVSASPTALIDKGKRRASRPARRPSRARHRAAAADTCRKPLTGSSPHARHQAANSATSTRRLADSQL